MFAWYIFFILLSHYIWSELLPLHSANFCLLIDIFKLFTLNIIIDMLELNSAILFFLFCLFSLFFICFLFPDFFVLFELFLEFHFYLPVVFLRVSFCIAFLMVALGITSYMHKLLQFAGVTFTVQIKHRALFSQYIPLVFPICENNCLKYFLNIHLEPH